MDEQEWLRRIDEHLEISKDYMREGHELMARNERAFLDLQSYLREATTALSLIAVELREGRRDQNERRREQNESRREQNESWQAWREEWKGWREEWSRLNEERRAESRAFLDALFAILDRLNNKPPPAAA